MQIETYNYLNKIQEFRIKIHKVLEELLNPNNNSKLAQELQSKLNVIEDLNDLYKNKYCKSVILEEYIEKIFSNLSEFKINFINHPSQLDKTWVKKLLVYDFIYYGPITLIFLDSIIGKFEDLNSNPVYNWGIEAIGACTVTEIRINNYQNIFIDTNKTILQWELNFLSSDQLETIIQRIISESNAAYNTYTRINTGSPIADFEHPCGFVRGSAIVAPASESAMLTLRIHPKQAYKLVDLEKFGMLDEQIRDFLVALQKAGATIAIAGTMGSGKTTLLSALAEYWPEQGRKATIEDTPELNPEIHDLIKLRTIELDNDSSHRIDVAKLTKACKRHSVKYVVLSEARDASAWDILQLSQTILGTLLTFHYTLRSIKHQVDQALNTLVALCKQNPIAPQGEDIKHLLASMIQVLVLVEQSPLDAKRRINRIYYITGYDEMNGGHFKYIELFNYTHNKGFSKVNICEELEEYLFNKGVKYKF